MSHYQRHVFVCTNQKCPGKKCCAASGGVDAFDYLKSRLLELEMHGPGKIRVSKSGCLGRCSLGPCIVVYPEAVWYSFDSNEDLEKIIQQHLLASSPVDELMIG